MRTRVVSSTILILAFASAGLVYGSQASRQQQQLPAQVYISGVAFEPAAVKTGAAAKLRVSIATTANVPAIGADGKTGIKAILELSENSNFGNVSYSVTPSRVDALVLNGRGANNIGEFTYLINPQNTGRGKIVSRIEIVDLQNNQPSVTRTMTTAEVTLLVGETTSGSKIPLASIQTGSVPCGYGNSFAGNPDCSSPVVIDVAGDSVKLTDAAGGVDFDINANGVRKERLSWTAANSDDAFLFLDRNENGAVDNALELFGNYTPQPYAPTPNGFVALGMYDGADFGGNSDGVIDGRDDVFARLRLWQDKNHNGVSEPEELRPLSGLGVTAISLDYKESRRHDRYGNQFRFRAKVYGIDHDALGRWAYDVFLVTAR